MVTVIVAVHFHLEVTTHDWETVATLVLLELQYIVDVAQLGDTDTERAAVFHVSSNLNVDGEIDIEVIGVESSGRTLTQLNITQRAFWLFIIICFGTDQFILIVLCTSDSDELYKTKSSDAIFILKASAISSTVE